MDFHVCEDLNDFESDNVHTRRSSWLAPHLMKGGINYEGLRSGTVWVRSGIQ